MKVRFGCIFYSTKLGWSSPNSVPFDDGGRVDTMQLEWRACCTPFSSTSIISYMVSCLASLHCKISSKVSEIVAMMKSMSSIVSTVCIYGLVSLDFFRNVGFVGETFLFLEVSASSIGSLGSVTSPCFYLSSSLSTLPSPPPPSESCYKIVCSKDKI
jgi:hypothetical protein